MFESFAANQDVRENDQAVRPLRATVALDPDRYPEEVRVGELLDLLPLLRTRCMPTLPEGVNGIADLAALENALGGSLFGFSPVSLQRRLGLVTPADLTGATKQLQRFGFARVWHQGKYMPLPMFAKQWKASAEASDYWVVCEANCEASIRQTALRWCQGVVRVMQGPEEGVILTTRFLPTDGVCAQIGVLLNDPHVGDCRSPNGRCAYCVGTGQLSVYPLDLIIADTGSTIDQDGFWHPALLKAIRSLRRARIIPEARFFAGQRVADFLQPYRDMSERTAFLFEHGIPWRRFLKPAAKRVDRAQDYFSWRGLHDYVYMVLGKIEDQSHKQRLKDEFQQQVCPQCRGTGAGWESAQLVCQDKTLLDFLGSVPLSLIRDTLSLKTPPVEAALKLGLAHLNLGERYSDLREEDRSRLLIATACSAPLENVTLLAAGDAETEPGQTSVLLARQGMSIVTRRRSEEAG